ncbi:hypothetical protein [Oligosphaera ethanolica]|uniref:Uncharacterized protein n=1 Tax=Oligosphaera ethanolica TaxID=760260 RepID=A0AAE3VH19_9BACT|nr:hypothetical protein [Oligosphaera ethanolica]MDQ0290437.1 hypothetical protein [Oligosphaera ethanolica]
MAACLAAARQVTPPGGFFYPQITQIDADFLFLTRRREGAKKKGWRHVLPLRGKSRSRGDFFIHRLRRLTQIFYFSREGAKARRRRDGGMSCRCASSHVAGGIFLSTDYAD